MDNHHPDSIPVQVGEETKYAKFGPKAVHYAASRHKHRFTFKNLQTDPGFEDFTEVAWISFLPDEPELTIDEFVDWGLPFSKIIEIASAAFTSLAEGPRSGPKKVGKRKPRKAKS